MIYFMILFYGCCVQLSFEHLCRDASDSHQFAMKEI